MKINSPYTRSLATISELVFPLQSCLDFLPVVPKEPSKSVSCLFKADIIKEFFSDYIKGNLDKWTFLVDKSLYPQCEYETHLHDAFALESKALQSSKFADFVTLAKYHLGHDSSFCETLKKYGILIWLYDPEFTNHFQLLVCRVYAGTITGEWTKNLTKVATPPALFHFRKAGLEAHCTNPLHNEQTWRGLFQAVGYRPNFYKKSEDEYQGQKPNPKWRRLTVRKLKETGRFKDLTTPITGDISGLNKYVDGPNFQQNSSAWLTARKKSVGGSSFGNILGLQERSSCRFLEKIFEEHGIRYNLKGDHARMVKEWEILTRQENAENVEAGIVNAWQQFCFDYGHEHEANGINVWLTLNPDRDLQETGMHFLNQVELPVGCPSPSFDVHASPDAISDDCVVEVKSRVPFFPAGDTFHYNGHKIYPTTIVLPVHYAQVQLEMLCTGRDRADLVIVTARRGATVFSVRRSDNWLTAAFRWLIWWHEKYVSGGNIQQIPKRDNIAYLIPKKTDNLTSEQDEYLAFLRMTAMECAEATASKLEIAEVPYSDEEGQPMFLDIKNENENNENGGYYLFLDFAICFRNRKNTIIIFHR